MNQPEWISVKDKLPRQGKEVLICYKTPIGRFIVKATKWKDDYGWHFTYNDVDGSNSLDDLQATHWMTLPKLPKNKIK